ncbi:hypothetical protein LHK_01291 [Laribacter hongkongensis HLHK9]|uniref:Uncharacterized protein n=1 Tax=Laribacter hongkongensis (strain HLHK9) TaxID=557598 RepID=C1D742_LARHH|nr:hypothetical protein LHK_01291 [Laribacter hongkongensis HLHK9]
MSHVPMTMNPVMMLLYKKRPRKNTCCCNDIAFKQVNDPIRYFTI